METSANGVKRRSSTEGGNPTQRQKYNDDILAQKEILDGQESLIAEIDSSERKMQTFIATIKAGIEEECFSALSDKFKSIVEKAQHDFMERILSKNVYSTWFTHLAEVELEKHSKLFERSAENNANEHISKIRAAARRYQQIQQESGLSSDDIMRRLSSYAELKVQNTDLQLELSDYKEKVQTLQSEVANNREEALMKEAEQHKATLAALQAERDSYKEAAEAVKQKSDKLDAFLNEQNRQMALLLNQ